MFGESFFDPDQIQGYARLPLPRFGSTTRRPSGNQAASYCPAVGVPEPFGSWPDICTLADLTWSRPSPQLPSPVKAVAPSCRSAQVTTLAPADRPFAKPLSSRRHALGTSRSTLSRPPPRPS